MNTEASEPVDAKPRKPRKLSVMQQVVIKHVTGMAGNTNQSDWKQQAKLFNVLSKMYGSDFLLWLTPPEGFKVLSLSVYRSVFGRTYLSEKLLEYKKLQAIPEEKKQEVELSSAKIGEDLNIKPTIRNLKDFINYGQKT